MSSVCKLLFVTVLGIFSTSEASTLRKCDSKECMTRTANSVYQQFMRGVPELGIAPHEPMRHALIEGQLGALRYQFFNVTLVGMDKCVFRDVEFDEPSVKLHVELSCPRVEMRGAYEISGTLLALPVWGRGTCSVTSGEYNFVIDSDVKITTDNDGRQHMTIKNYRVASHAVEPIVYDFKNLFNGQKDLSDAVHKFANENWSEVANYVEDPVWYAHARELVTTANKFLEATPLQ